MTSHHSRRDIIGSAAAMGALACLPSISMAKTFPDISKPIRAICPFPPGTSADTIARAYAKSMSESLGANVLIDNRSGAEGTIGLQAASSAPPDGYTILFTTISTQAVNPHLFKTLTVDPRRSFVPILGTSKAGFVMAVGPSVPYKTAHELLAAAKANPGKFTYGSTSATTRLAGHIVGKAAGVELLNIPYKNFSDLISNVMNRQVDILFFDMASLKPFVSQGIRVLAATTSTRLPDLPDVPTLAEQGVPGVEIVGWHAAYAPTGTPPSVVAVLRDAMRKAASSKLVKDHFATYGNQALDLGGDEFVAFERAEYEKWGIAVREGGLAGTL